MEFYDEDDEEYKAAGNVNKFDDEEDALFSLTDNLAK